MHIYIHYYFIVNHPRLSIRQVLTISVIQGVIYGQKTDAIPIKEYRIGLLKFLINNMLSEL